MATMANRIKDELINRFNASSWKPIQITMKKSGDRITLVPCADVGEVKDADSCVYILAYQTPMPYISGPLDELSEKLAIYDELRSEHGQDLIDLKIVENQLRSGYDRDGKLMTRQAWEDKYDVFSDWSKDVTGCRIRIPRPENLL